MNTVFIRLTTPNALEKKKGKTRAVKAKAVNPHRDRKIHPPR